MKAVLLSIRPEWCRKILSDEKSESANIKLDAALTEMGIDDLMEDVK